MEEGILGVIDIRFLVDVAAGDLDLSSLASDPQCYEFGYRCYLAKTSANGLNAMLNKE
ncbi:hypothetical protein R4536_09435 [Vibrio cholerae]|uniref:hypothetical protein n=1 Tax=Vibrio cholerae TaxID=666 RepID=UPI00021A989E|nr:hypothetical protein [Vibrio cholerae]EGS71356.1 hypothetical protein VCBJG01_0763 [Vibrio cholerae BJG-01]EHB5528780.1 hypothetical protein [Vibrio cholerae]EJL6849780.1 hypothetical protein [Vibrio cholerae]EJL6948594.1 hypothetical protein [Vibrio cholerae]EKF9265237.1 hypothetical protein [Vibrio cholerae]